MGQKRARDSKALKERSQKRKRVDKPRTVTDEDGQSDAVYDVDDLNWKEVALPDRLEDAEGFFGLEEIDGVDIVRSQGNGEIRFKVRRHKPVLPTKHLSSRD